MCFGIPVIVSNQVGAGVDLIHDGQNRYRVDTDGDSLSLRIKQIADLSEEERSLVGMKSVDTMSAVLITSPPVPVFLPGAVSPTAACIWPQE